MPLLYRLKGPSRPVPVVEDVSVPPDVLPDFLVRMQNVLKRRQVTASLLCHAGHGQLHIQPFLDLDDPNDVQRMRLMAEELYEEVFGVGGTIGGEHAYGLSRTQFLRRQAGPLYEVLRQVKQIFDPENVLNPGKIVGDDPELMTRNLRPPLRQPQLEGDLPAEEPDPETECPPVLRDLVELQVNWDPQRVADATAACNRCGECRSQIAAGADVPHLPLPARRGGLAAGQGEPDPRHPHRSIDLSRLTSDEFKDVADLCVHCHTCRLECPAGVDIPKLMMEAKAAYVRSQRPALRRLGHDPPRPGWRRSAAWSLR